MSLHATVWALKHAEVGDPIAKLILIGLADHARDDGTAAFPSQATLAAYAETTTRTVRTKLALLEDAGLIRRGDQRLVNHIQGNRRPIVWDLGYAPQNANIEDENTPCWAEAPSPQQGGSTFRAEAPRHSDRKLSSYKPSKNPPFKTGEGISPSAPARETPTPTTDDEHIPPQRDLGGVRREVGDPAWRDDRCPTHQHDQSPPPCGACKDARLAVERAAAERVRADTAAHAEAEAAKRAALRSAIRSCTLCDDRGYRGAALCTHDPALDDVRVRGATIARTRLRGGDE
ncbi:hypothetical protein GCM10027418_06260 [Mariniluteicoccus endophyticus]